MQRRTLLSGLAALTALGAGRWTTGCSSAKPLVIGIHPWIGYETLYIARDLNFLPPDGRLREGVSASDSLATLEAGQIDGACLTLDETLRARAAGVPLTAVLVFDVSAGADMVLARPEIQRLGDLVGKRLGVENGAVGAVVLRGMLQAAGLPDGALTLVDCPIDRQLAAWRDGAIDAVITYEPTASTLQHEGAVRLFDSRKMPDTIFDVLAVRRDRAAECGSVLRQLLSAHFRALAHIRTSRQDSIYRIATHESISPSDVQTALAGVALPSLAANRTYLTACLSG